jgi:Zn finger protein HypA/HybF involved in hydrogenase expression
MAYAESGGKMKAYVFVKEGAELRCNSCEEFTAVVSLVDGVCPGCHHGVEVVEVGVAHPSPADDGAAGTTSSPDMVGAPTSQLYTPPSSSGEEQPKEQSGELKCKACKQPMAADDNAYDTCSPCQDLELLALMGPPPSLPFSQYSCDGGEEVASKEQPVVEDMDMSPPSGLSSEEEQPKEEPKAQSPTGEQKCGWCGDLMDPSVPPLPISDCSCDGDEDCS